MRISILFLLFFKTCASDVFEENKDSVNEFNILDFHSEEYNQTISQYCLIDDDKKNFPSKYFKVYLWAREHTSGMCSHPAIPRLFLFLEKNSSEYQIAKKRTKSMENRPKRLDSPSRPDLQRNRSPRHGLGLESGRAGQIARAAGSCVVLGWLGYYCCSLNFSHDCSDGFKFLCCSCC